MLRFIYTAPYLKIFNNKLKLSHFIHSQRGEKIEIKMYNNIIIYVYIYMYIDLCMYLYIDI